MVPLRLRGQPQFSAKSCLTHSQATLNDLLRVGPNRGTLLGSIRYNYYLFSSTISPGVSHEPDQLERNQSTN